MKNKLEIITSEQNENNNNNFIKIEEDLASENKDDKTNVGKFYQIVLKYIKYLVESETQRSV